MNDQLFSCYECKKDLKKEETYRLEDKNLCYTCFNKLWDQYYKLDLN